VAVWKIKGWLDAMRISSKVSPHAVLETSLYVSDLARALAFYENVLGLKKIDVFPANRGAALQVGAGPSVLLLFCAALTRTGGTFPEHGTEGHGHVAFRIEQEELEAWRSRLRQHSVPIERELVFRGNPPSLYFRDPDGNSLELSVAAIWPFASGPGAPSNRDE
jgi:catechol 2,3-dioxygenase-like lactoylglutathione lyase family enzyme